MTIEIIDNMNWPQITQLHFWYTSLKEELYDEGNELLLNAAEITRANRFKFAIHRHRFITARATLRAILSLYLKRSPTTIEILQSKNGKPYLKDSALQFNLSHSHDLAIYVISNQIQIGIDIEKIRAPYSKQVAERFLSSEELKHFLQLTAPQQLNEFYRIWTGKEALIKAQGKTLSFSLAAITLPFSGGLNKITFSNNYDKTVWYLENLKLFPDYQTSIVTDKMVSRYCFWEWTTVGEKKWRDDIIKTPIF